MWKRLQQFFDRIESRWSLYSLLAGSGIISGITGWIASGTKWLDKYGPIAWWFAALLGGAFFVFIFLGIAWGRWKLIQAKAVNKWAKKVDAINPMDSEFRNQRINLADLANPVTKQISRKRFINCELIGPATIFLGSGNGFRNSSFLNVNMIPVKNNLRISAVYLMIECDIIESVILEANILFPIAAIPFLENGFPNGQIDYLSLTGIPEIDNRSPQGIAPGTPL